ncbi:MAG: ATP-grasp domain-containing protein [Clostridia bacterium]|nr:ATP-grasp domain-containing protein [Clostridia bacterium]
MIGAGFLQTFVIKKAKELGYYTIAIDGNPDAEGFKFCHEYKPVNIIDPEACLEYAKEMNIDGVLTAATDYGVISMAYVAKELGLPAINLESAMCIKNKYQVRRKLAEADADDTGMCFEVSDIGDLTSIKSHIKYPVMVKPCDGSGSRGAAKVDSWELLEEACKIAIDCSLTSKALIEPFIENGTEYGAESFVYNGEVYVLGIMKKHMTKPPYYAELGHQIPSELDCAMENKVRDCVTKAIKALGVNHGSVNMDMLITKEGSVHIVDIGARMGGNLIGSHIIPIGTGIMYMENMIKAAVGDKADFSAANPPHPVATRLLALTPGVVDELPDFDSIAEENDVTIEHHLSAGDTINEYHTNLDGCGYVVATASIVKTANEKAEKTLNEIDSGIKRK